MSRIVQPVLEDLKQNLLPLGSLSETILDKAPRWPRCAEARHALSSAALTDGGYRWLMGDTAGMAEAPSPARFVELMTPAVLEAARIARALEGRVENRPKQGEGSAVKAAMTRADSAVQEAILSHLRAHFPEVALEAEEDTPSVAHFPSEGPARVVIDPIDGTLRFYLQELGPYGVMVGLCVDGCYESALVALPRERVVFHAVRGGEAWQRVASGGVQEVRAAPDGAKVLVSHEMPEIVQARLRDLGFEPVLACGGAISVAPLLTGVRAGLRLAGSAKDISIRGRIGLAIARAAGAHVADEGGLSFPEEIHREARALVVAADPADLEPLAQVLAASLRARAFGAGLHYICV